MRNVATISYQSCRFRYGLRKPGSNDIRFFTTPHNNKNKKRANDETYPSAYLEQTVKKVMSDNNENISMSTKNLRTQESAHEGIYNQKPVMFTQNIIVFQN